MTAWGLALSDAVLAAVGLWVAVMLPTGASPLIRVVTRTAILMICAAALIGALRYAGMDAVSPLHTWLSDQSAIIGLPLLLFTLLWQDHASPSKTPISLWLVLASGAFVIFAAAWQQRPVSAGLCLLMLSLAAMRGHAIQNYGPLLMLALLIALAALRAWPVLPLPVRLMALHIGLAGLLLLFLQSTKSPRPVGDG